MRSDCRRARQRATAAPPPPPPPGPTATQISIMVNRNTAFTKENILGIAPQLIESFSIVSGAIPAGFTLSFFNPDVSPDKTLGISGTTSVVESSYPTRIAVVIGGVTSLYDLTTQVNSVIQVYTPAIISVGFSPNVVNPGESAPLFITVGGLRPGFVTNIGPIVIQAEDGVVYNGVVGGNSSANYDFTADSSGNGQITVGTFVRNNPLAADGTVSVRLNGVLFLPRTALNAPTYTPRFISLVRLGGLFESDQRSGFFRYYFDGLQPNSQTSVTITFNDAGGLFIDSYTGGAHAYTLTSDGAGTAILDLQYGTFVTETRTANVTMTAFNNIQRVSVSLVYKQPLPVVTEFTAMPSPEFYYSGLRVVANTSNLTPGAVYTLATFYVSGGFNYIYDYYGQFQADASGNILTTRDIYHYVNGYDGPLTFYIAEGAQGYAQMSDVGANGVNVVAQAQTSLTTYFVDQSTVFTSDAGQ